MALKVGELYAVLNLQDKGFTKGLSKAHTQINATAKAITHTTTKVNTLADANKKAGKSTSDMGDGASISAGKVKMLAAAIEAAVVALVGFRLLSIKAAADLEQTTVSFEAMLGSAKDAKAFVDLLQKATMGAAGFGFKDATAGAKRLLAVGFSAQEIVPMIEAVGTAVAALGGGSQMAAGIIEAIAKMKGETKALKSDFDSLEKQNIPAWQMLADTLGVDVAEAMAKVAEGAVSADDAIGALTTGMNKKFGDAKKKMAGTLGGLIDQIGKSLTTVMQDLGSIDLPGFKEMAAAIGKAFARWPEVFAAIKRWVDQLRPALKELVSAFAPMWSEMFKGKDAFTTTIGVISTAVKGLAKSLSFIAAVIKQVRNVIVLLFRALSSVFVAFDLLIMKLTGRTVTLIEMLAKAGVTALETAQEMQKLDTGDKKREAKQAAKDEAEAILGIVQAQRDAREEERKRIAQRMGWTGLADIWKTAQVAGMRSGLAAPPSTETTFKNLPDTAALKAIKATLDLQKAIQTETLRVIRDRLGAYA